MEKVKKEKLVSTKNSIKAKLIVIILLIVIIPMTIATTASYITSVNKAKEDAQDSIEWQAWYIEDLFAKVIDKNVVAMQTLATSPSTIAFMQSGLASIPEEVMLSQLNAIDESLADGNTTILTNADGKQILRASGELLDVSDRDYFTLPKSGYPIYVSDVVVNKSTGARQITISVPVLDNTTGAFLGIVQRNYDMKDLRDILVAEVDGADEAFVLDRNGGVAATSLYEITGEQKVDRSNTPIITDNLEEGFYEYDDQEKGYSTYIAYVKEPNTNYSVAVVASKDKVLAAAKHNALMSIMISIVMAIIASIIAVFTANAINNPIQDITKALNKLSNGEFEKIENKKERKDEFGVMIKSTNSLIEKLTEIVNNIKEHSSAIAISSSDLSEMTTQISQATEDVSNAVQEIASGATQQADEIQTAVNATDTVNVSVTSIKDTSVIISEAAEEMENASKTTSSSIDNLQKSSDETSSKIEDISKAIEATKLAVEVISEKVEGITAIATQTNLLSLNASIEAARAGEAGKGFAVVASEIGTLATNSKELADAIKVEMQSLLEKSEIAVTAVGSVKESNKDTQTALASSLESVNKMIDEIDKTVKGIEEISTGTDESINAKNSVVDVMSALSAISEENAASAEETGASMEELNATVTTLNESAAGLKDIAEKLNKEMEFFKL